MPDLLEAPAHTSTAEADTSALKASFTSSLAEAQAAQGDIEPVVPSEPVVAPTSKPAPEPKAAAAEESIVPKTFTEKPKPVEKPADEEIPANAPAKQLREALARREAKIKELQTERDTLRQKSEVAPTGPTKDQEAAHKAAVERAEALEQQLERVAYQDSPKYQKYGTEIVAELDSAKGYLEGSNISPTVLELAASQPPAARAKTLRESGMDAETISLVAPHLARADAIRRDRDASLANWKESLTAEQTQEQARQAQVNAQQRAQEETLFKTVGEKMRSELEAFQKVEGHEKWNAMVDQNEKDAAEFFAGKKSMQELAELAYHGVSARTTRIMNAELRRQLDAANDELGRLRAAQPGTGKAVDPKAADSTPATPKDHHRSVFNAEVAKLAGGQ